MCRKWFVLVFLSSLPGFMGAARSATIAHWQFNGTPGQEIVTDADIENGYVAYKFKDATYGANTATDVFYGLPNLTYDTSGTSAEFVNDPGDNDPGVGFVVPDTGVGTPLDLSTVGAFTIEAFICPYSLRQSVIVRKYGGSPGQYFIDLRVDGDVRLSINSDGNAVVAGTGAVTANEWYHVAAVFDETDLAAPMKMYIDGELKGTAAFSDRPGDSPRGLGIGCIIRDNLNPPGNSGQFFHGRIDEVRLSDTALSVDEFLLNTVEGVGRPSPADGATDVPPDVVLSWTPTEFADQHDVYFGTSFDNVNNATNLDPMGPDNVYRARQAANSYVIGDSLDFGQTYYWRVDEVNGPPDYTVYEGNVWQFTVEPFAYPIENVTATASSSFNAGTGPENTVNGSGLDDDDLHSIQQTDMWLTSPTVPPPIWIQYEFDKVYKLHQMWVWNFNQNIESIVGFGLKDIAVEYSVNGTDWTELGGVSEFAQAPGAIGYAHNTTVEFAGVAAKYIKITANDNWGVLTQYGLSEVRFLYVPVQAREPDPVSGATNLPLDTTLSFRAGRGTAAHDVYLGTDKQAVTDGTADVTTVTETSYGPLALDLGQTYYWRIDEVNETETPATWQGDIWDFATQEYFVLEDFEAYDDYEPNRIFDTWIDGWGVATNGATMGYPNPIFVLDEHFVETTIVHGGSQSAPLFYDNTAGAIYSEVTHTVDSPRDWTKAGVKALTLWFHGDPNNSGTEQLYVKLNGAKVSYDGDADNIMRTGWQTWYINLAALAVNLGNVTELTIGLERSGAVGGMGVVYFDDIRLSPYDRQLVTPAEPDPAGLVVHYEFEGTTGDSSGNGLDGTAVGDPVFVAGKVGQAISLDGIDDYVNVTGYKGILGPSAVTVTAWIKTTSTETGAIVGWGPDVAGQRFGFRVDAGRLRTEHHGGNVQGDSSVNDGGWHHVAVTVQANATISYPEVMLYLDGLDDTRPTTDPDVYNITAAEDVSIGRRPASNDRFFMGQIDDVHIHDRALSPEEIAWSSGRTKPFDKPF